MDTQMVGACVQTFSSLSNIVHVATANKAMYALAEACVIIINFMKPIPILWGEKAISNMYCVHYEPSLPFASMYSAASLYTKFRISFYR